MKIRGGKYKRRKTRNETLSYLKKHFSTSNCKGKEWKWGETEERGRNKREREKKKLEIRLP